MMTSPPAARRRLRRRLARRSRRGRGPDDRLQDDRGSGPGTATSYFSSEKMRTGDAERETIVEYAPGQIVSIDHKKKEYSEITLAEIEAAMKAAQAKMERRTPR